MDASRTTDSSDLLRLALCLCIALVVLFWPVFFQGKVLVPGDIPNTDPFLSTGSAVRPPVPSNTLLSDEIEQFYVYHSVARAGLAAGEGTPLWNPYLFTGQPLVANSQSSLFYPPNLLLHLLSPGRVATLRILLNLFSAGFFTFLFCRELKVSAGGSLLSALSFAFSGPLLVWAGYPLANVVTCLPFLMWAGERLLARGDLVRTVLLGAGMGLSLLGGHPETTFQVLAVFSLYFLARLALSQGELPKGRIFGYYLLAVLLGALLSGVQLVPFLDFMRQSSTFARGGRGSHGAAGGSFFYSPEWLAHLATAFTLICPNFFGNPLDHNYIWPSQVFQNYNEQSVYFGLVPLALAVAALCAKDKRRPVLILALLALFCLTVAWHLPGFEAVSHLPIFSMAPNKRLRLPFVFLAAVLAGFGYDALVRRDTAGEGRRALLGAGGVLALALILYLWVLTLRFTLGPSLSPDTFRYLLLYDVFSFSRWRTYLPLAVAALAAAGYLWSRRGGTERLLPPLLIGLTAFELVALGWGYHTAMPESEILPPAPAVEFLKKREREPFRILTTDGFFYPNFAAVYGIADVAGYDVPVYQRYSDLYLAQGGKSYGGQIDSRQQWDPDWPLVDFLNVKYVISPRELAAPKFRKVNRVANLNVYQNDQALPRAFLVYQAETIADHRALLERVLKESADLGKKAFLEEPAPPLPGPAPGSAPGAAGSAPASGVALRSFGTDRVVFQVQTDRPGLLVLSDLYTPDWTASVDGAPAKLYRADYAYRAVSVPQGAHTVSFSYAPASYRVGLALTGAGLVISLLLAGWSLRRQARATRP